MLEIFDTSYINTDNHISKDGLITELLEKLNIILKKEFPNNPRKQTVRVYKNRLSFAAPCCGDSASDNNKKRGNIILEGRYKNLYKCHNCGTSMSVNSFFRKYNQPLSFEAINYITENPTNFSTNTESFSENIYDVSLAEQYAIDRNLFKNVFELEECNAGGTAWKYLISRKQFLFEKFLYSSKHDILFILNLTPNKKILGMQTRHLFNNYNGPKYKTYSLSKIYQTFFRQNKTIPDEIDTISMIFNILCVDYSKIVTVTEGPMDSFMIPNAIALCGAGKHITFPFKCRYLFDSDKEGRKHAIEYMEAGNEVFLWEKYKRDNKLPDQKKWDINDVYIWASKNNVNLTQIDNYFSNDTLDVIDV